MTDPMQRAREMAIPVEDWQWLADQLRAWPIKRVHPERTMCDGALRPMAADVIEAALALLTREEEVRGEERERAARMCFAEATRLMRSAMEVKGRPEMTVLLQQQSTASKLATAIRDGAAAEDGWRGIETAPDDNSQFLAWCPRAGLIIMAQYGGRSETWSLSGNIRNPEPTHWRPLPLPPKEAVS